MAKAPVFNHTKVHPHQPHSGYGKPGTLKGYLHLTMPDPHHGGEPCPYLTHGNWCEITTSEENGYVVRRCAKCGAERHNTREHE